MSHWMKRLQAASWAVQSAVLAGAVVLAGAAVVPAALAWAGVDGLWAALAAGGLCLAGGQIALLLARPFREPQRAWIGFTIGMAPRMGVPLVAALIVNFSAGTLVGSGFLYYLIVFYFVTLGVETAASVPTTPPRGPSPPRP